MPAARSSFLGEALTHNAAASARSLSSMCAEEGEAGSPPTPPYRQHHLPPSTDEEVDERSPYDRVLYGLHHDPRWLKEVTLGRRVGFYRFRGELGQGNFSTVRLALHQLTRDKVAIKVIDKSKLDQKTQRMLAREIANMDTLAHPNIIRLFEVVESLSRIHLVLEFAGGGELFNTITTEGRMTEAQAAAVFTQVLSAITYLHGLSIIHRDIKAENVFVAGPGLVKLGDFGFSTRVSHLEQQLSTFCGSPPYAAPELYKDESYLGPAVDTWALGVLLFFILTADMPFKASTVAGLKRHILTGVYETPSHVSPEASDLISSLLVQDPTQRPDTATIAAHAFLADAPSPPPPLDPYVLAPTFDSSPDYNEAEALQTLSEWGITRGNLQDSVPLGARSPALATYRILVHRLTTPAPAHSSLSAPSQHTQQLSSDPSTPTKETASTASPRRRLKLRNGHTPVSLSPGVKSRACAIV
ncbi:serine/threonine-protein kinase NIM1-like isoform X1 [Portunus trituberculatus]|uniref:serine/threonine-protein kinase NIM1-like isoform X1 n=1 Tax=Portunus trituberculatus TaxID=210409 RepID=UPI001E1CC9BB|nr:serine/threonine-protein kinase NIM1-like isoform X1 [Portunus trituberculatus]